MEAIKKGGGQGAGLLALISLNFQFLFICNADTITRWTSLDDKDTAPHSPAIGALRCSKILSTPHHYHEPSNLQIPPSPPYLAFIYQAVAKHPHTLLSTPPHRRISIFVSLHQLIELLLSKKHASEEPTHFLLTQSRIQPSPSCHSTTHLNLHLGVKSSI